MTVDLIIANLMQNAATAQQIDRRRRRRGCRGARTCECAGRARNRDHHAARRRARADVKRTSRRSSESTLEMNIVVTGSIAFDYLMSFPGQVHRALPAGAHAARQPELSRRHDGQAARRLRAEHRLHAGAARRAAAADGDGRARTSATTGSGSRRPASTRRSCKQVRRQVHARRSSAAPTPTNNQIASFYTGAMADAGELSFRDVDGLRAGDHLAERSGRDGAVRRGVPDARHPVTSSIRASSARACRGDELRDGIAGATIVICNDYEFELMRQKTGLERGRHPRRRPSALIVTRGEHGSSVHHERRRRSTSPAVTPHRIVDPTGVGDAFRGGLMKGLALGAAATRSARSSAASPRRTRSSTWAARATPTPGTSSASAMKRTSAACSRTVARFRGGTAAVEKRPP